MPDLSVIIPTYNEETYLPRLLMALCTQEDIDIQVIVADCGSTDQTLSLAEQHGATLVTAPRGRAKQMNAGVKKAQSKWLFFIHADCELPQPDFCKRALDAIKKRTALLGHTRVAGHCTLHFTETDPQQALFYTYLEAKTASNRPHTINGDQGCLIHTTFFHALGTYDEQLPFLEDQRLAKSVRTHGQWMTLPCTIHTSARRFETEGFEQRYTIMSIIMGSYVAGFDELFETPQNLYPSHPKTGKLDIMSFFRELKIKNHAMDPVHFLSVWFNTGRFARENCWQLFFNMDIRRELQTQQPQRTWTQIHDRFIAPLLNNPIVDAFTGALAYWIVIIYLPAYWADRQ